MTYRIFFPLGVLLGAVSVFTLRLRQAAGPQRAEQYPLLGLVGEAVLVCDTVGTITYLNAAAQEWFGREGEAYTLLQYPSGQPVPPGQLPLTRALRTGKAGEGAGYLCVSPGGTRRVLEVSARTLPAGGAAAVFKDITELLETQSRKTEGERQADTLRRLCRRLAAAADPEGLVRSIADSALSLLQAEPSAPEKPRVRLYAYDASRKQLTRLASAPEDRPKRPRSQKSAQAPTFTFDAACPLLWGMYIAKEPFRGGGSEALGENPLDHFFSFPLLAGGMVIGHLSLLCEDPYAFNRPALRESLELLASLAALALAGPSQAAQSAHLAQQVNAIREVVGAVASRLDPGKLADLVGQHIRRVLDAEVCTLAVSDGERLRLLGEEYKDALLHPERHAPDDPAMTRGTAEKALRTDKSAQCLGDKNPALAEGIWSAFAGRSGRHSALSVPLPAGQGVLTVLRGGDTPFSDDQVRFMETLAALTATALPPTASATAGRTGS